MLLYNQIRFDPNNFLEAASIKESRISYIPISSQVRNIIPHKVQTTNLVLQDYDSIQLDEWTKLTKDYLFKLTE